jgi:hypothetical protein
MNTLRSIATGAIVAVSLGACIGLSFSKGTGRVSGLRNAPVDQGAPHYYKTPPESAVSSIQRSMIALQLRKVDVRRINDSVWMLTGQKECFPLPDVSCVWERGQYSAFIRAVVKDEGEHGIAVRIVTREQLCTGHDFGGTCKAEDTEADPAAQKILAQLDKDLPTPKTSPVMTP